MSNYRFHKLVPLAHLPDPASALEVLTRLSEDAAIQHVMQKHKFSILILTELDPRQVLELLGLNVPGPEGITIKLRLRSPDYQGFRTYGEIRRVLCHELTHCVWGPHDDNVSCSSFHSCYPLMYGMQFKALNSQLNREVAEFERAKASGTHYLSEPGYEPSSHLEAEAIMATSYSNVLGGSGASSFLDDSREGRRQRVLDATMARLRKEEEEIEDHCGTIV